MPSGGWWTSPSGGGRARRRGRARGGWGWGGGGGGRGAGAGAPGGGGAGGGRGAAAAGAGGGPDGDLGLGPPHRRPRLVGQPGGGPRPGARRLRRHRRGLPAAGAPRGPGAGGGGDHSLDRG